MSQPATVCCNKVQAELNAKIESLSQQRVFCHNIVEEECKEYCRDTLNSIATIIKANEKVFNMGLAQGKIYVTT